MTNNKAIETVLKHPKWTGLLVMLSNSDAPALSEILVRSASVKRKASKGAVGLTKRLFSTCTEIVCKK